MSIFKRMDKNSTKEKPMDVVVAREDIRRVEAPRRDFMQRLFGPVFPRFTVFARTEAEDASYSFSADPSTGIVAALQKIVSARQEEGASTP